MSNVASTSLEAYHKYADSLPEKRATILRHFLKHPDMNFTNRELAVALHTIPSNITGKVFTLRQHGLLVYAERRPCRVTENYCKAWMVNWGALKNAHVEGIEIIEGGNIVVIAKPWIPRDQWLYLNSILKRKGYQYTQKGVWKKR
jgi:hypothetical protein